MVTLGGWFCGFDTVRRRGDARRWYVRDWLTTLAKRWDVKLIAVTAGAGIGKTTLLAQAIEQNLLDPRGR